MAQFTTPRLSVDHTGRTGFPPSKTWGAGPLNAGDFTSMARKQFRLASDTSGNNFNNLRRSGREAAQVRRRCPTDMPQAPAEHDGAIARDRRPIHRRHAAQNLHSDWQVSSLAQGLLLAPAIWTPIAYRRCPHGTARQLHPLAGALFDRGVECSLGDDGIAAVTAATSYLLSPEWRFTRFAPSCRRRLGAANDRLAQ